MSLHDSQNGVRSSATTFCRCEAYRPSASARQRHLDLAEPASSDANRNRHRLEAPRRDLTFLSRLAAQIPAPRRHVLTYHGVLAAAACKRNQIVPGYQEFVAHVAQSPGTTRPTPERIRPERYPWSELLQRTFLIDVLTCPCGAQRRVLSLVCDPAQIHRCLTHLGLPTQPPTRAPPREVSPALPFR